MTRRGAQIDEHMPRRHHHLLDRPPARVLLAQLAKLDQKVVTDLQPTKPQHAAVMPLSQLSASAATDGAVKQGGNSDHEGDAERQPGADMQGRRAGLQGQKAGCGDGESADEL